MKMNLQLFGGNGSGSHASGGGSAKSSGAGKANMKDYSKPTLEGQSLLDKIQHSRLSDQKKTIASNVVNKGDRYTSSGGAGTNGQYKTDFYERDLGGRTALIGLQYKNGTLIDVINYS